MKATLFFVLLSIPLLSMKCTESCDNYKLKEEERRLVEEVDPVLRYVSANRTDTIRLKPVCKLDQGPDKERKSWTKGYRSCGAAATVDYGTTRTPQFRVLFDLNKQHTRAVEIPSLQIGRVFLKKGYDQEQLSLFNEQSRYTLHYVGERTFNGKVVEEVYEITGTGSEAGNACIYSLYEGLLRIEEQGKSWERIWD